MTTPEAQFGIAQLLRPPDNFVTDYEGSDRPLPFPGVLDEQAGRPGYDPYLMGGLPVPIGSRVLIWLPFIYNNSPISLNDFEDFSYVYKIIFRLRNVRDHRDPGRAGRRKPYHLPSQAPGAPDTSGATPQARFILPACIWVVAYQQAESRLVVTPTLGGNSNPAVRIYPEGFMPNSIQVGTPFAPPGNANLGVIQQGVLDPGGAGVVNANDAVYHPIFIDACGDDMIILCEKEQPPNPQPADPWAFAGADSRVATFFTSSNFSGIYVLTGSMGG